jgi:dihydrofolate reductase
VTLIEPLANAAGCRQKIIIAAMDKNHLIGAGNGLPWHIPEEYQQFLNYITGNTVIWGWKTWTLFSRIPPSKNNLVLSHSKLYLPGAQVVTSIAEAFRIAETFSQDIFVAGGASVYRQTLHLVDKLYLSVIPGEFSGDAYFPAFDPADWIIETQIAFDRYNFLIYKAKRTTK